MVVKFQTKFFLQESEVLIVASFSNAIQTMTIMYECKKNVKKRLFGIGEFSRYDFAADDVTTNGVV